MITTKIKQLALGLTLSVMVSQVFATTWADNVRDALNPRNDSQQNIVVSLKQDPASEEGFEAACVALQLATLLQSKGANVNMFVTLGGVRLVDNALLERDMRKCETAQGPAPLHDILIGFITAGNNVDRIVICGLCWIRRYGTDQEAMANIADGAVMGNAEKISELFLTADKVMDF